MKRNLVGKFLRKIKIFVQDFVPIRTAMCRYCEYEYEYEEHSMLQQQSIKTGTGTGTIIVLPFVVCTQRSRLNLCCCKNC